jgi:hypothetical protein
MNDIITNALWFSAALVCASVVFTAVVCRMFWAAEPRDRKTLTDKDTK